MCMPSLPSGKVQPLYVYTLSPFRHGTSVYVVSGTQQHPKDVHVSKGPQEAHPLMEDMNQ